MERWKQLVAKWLVPLVAALSALSIFILGLRATVIGPALIAVGNAAVVALWFRNRLDGLTAYYFVSRTDPDDDEDDIKVKEKLMLGVAIATILAPVYITIMER